MKLLVARSGRFTNSSVFFPLIKIYKTDTMKIDQIFKNNQKWVEDKLQVDKGYFKDLAKGQSPAILYIGCSDSRVTAEAMMGAKPGDLFVHRNIANMVVNTDLSSISVINYAVNHLKVKHVVVCGHYYCGGVKAGMQSSDLGILNPWLREIRDVYRLNKEELDGISDEEQRYKRLVELNVKEQCVNVIKNENVQKAYEENRIQVHGWVFDIGTGKIIDLDINFRQVMDDLIPIYEIS